MISARKNSGARGTVFVLDLGGDSPSAMGFFATIADLRDFISAEPGKYIFEDHLESGISTYTKA